MRTFSSESERDVADPADRTIFPSFMNEKHNEASEQGGP